MSSGSNLYIGTYSGTGSQGIYRTQILEDHFSAPEVFAEIQDPKYLVTDAGKLITIEKTAEGAGVALYDYSGTRLTAKIHEEDTSCYVTVHGEEIYTANYHQGHFSRLICRDNRISEVETVSFHPGAGCHQVIADEHYLVVPVLLDDVLKIYTHDLKEYAEVRFAKGTGPRHGIYSHDHRHLYVVSELSNELYRIRVRDWKILDTLRLSSRKEASSAAIRIHPVRDLLYVSVRGINRILVIGSTEMKILQDMDCGGDHPRDILVNENYCLTANRFSNQVRINRLEPDGKIGETLDQIDIPEPVCLAIN